ncbi:hypothetical protein [Bradyrhizobium sp. WSM471]|uniref:hypothetical protein n=1 Tax=Bradyrhizobium sp. WSM471 TaxID=319017 RepID=UPI00024D2D9A|nr:MULTISPECIES: hypothetical protein [Bradyrhizobium]EHR03225.1 hypothetical protein Bra471DRAFT_03994 [Bradyrhizobium sp. WSM471]UFW38453.1 hypothetical protein BcanWSM471_19600 [Bradyrhizobium canariense]
MSYDHKAVIEAQYNRLAAERAQAVYEYEAGRTAEDEYTTMDAAGRILELDAKAAALDKVASNLLTQMQQPRGNAYGLSDDEVTIAKGISGGDDRLTNEDRLKIYAQQKEKLRYQRATGQYRDDQGMRR